MSSFTFVDSFCRVLIAFQYEVAYIFMQLMDSDEHPTLSKRDMSVAHMGKMRILLKKIGSEQAILL